MKPRLALLVSAALVLTSAAGSALAEEYNFLFGTWIGDAPSYQPSENFASLSVSTDDHKVFTFDLKVFDNLDTAFGNPDDSHFTFIGKAIFNVTSGNDPYSTEILPGDWGVSNVVFKARAPNVDGVGFDFADKFCGGSGCSSGDYASSRLTAGEEVKWKSTFANEQSTAFFATPPVALHVQGFNVEVDSAGYCYEINEITSGWYTPTEPIPEPETYVMLLAGLGLMGAVARRRKQKAA